MKGLSTTLWLALIGGTGGAVYLHLLEAQKESAQPPRRVGAVVEHDEACPICRSTGSPLPLEIGADNVSATLRSR